MRKRTVTFPQSIVNTLPEYMTAYMLAKKMRVTNMCVSHWINIHGLPTSPQTDRSYVIERTALVEWLRSTGRMK